MHYCTKTDRPQDQIFAALADQLVGKIYICFTDSKEWSRDSLLECYALKFSYTDLGDFGIYIEWVGSDDTPLTEKISMDVFKSLKQVVIGCPQLPDPFYTRLFVSSVDSKTKLEGAWAGNGHGVREALMHFKARKGSSSGRIGRFRSVRRHLQTVAQLTTRCSAAIPCHRKRTINPLTQMGKGSLKVFLRRRTQTCQTCTFRPSRHQLVQHQTWQHRQPGRQVSRVSARSRDRQPRFRHPAVIVKTLQMLSRSQEPDSIPMNAMLPQAQLRIVFVMETVWPKLTRHLVDRPWLTNHFVEAPRNVLHHRIAWWQSLRTKEERQQSHQSPSTFVS